MPVNRFKIQEKINAIGIDRCYAAEIYTKVTAEYLGKLLASKPDEAEQVYIQSMIGNIRKIRQYRNAK